MSPDELYKLSPYLLKKYPDPADLEKAIYNKFNKNLIDLTVDDLNKARGTAVGTKIKVPTIMGGAGEVDIGNMGRTFLKGVTFGFGDNLEASLTGNDINVIREEMENYRTNNPGSALALELGGSILTGTGIVGGIKTLGKLGLNQLTKQFPNSLKTLNKYIKKRGKVAEKSKFLPTREELIGSGIGGAVYAKGVANEKEDFNIPLIDEEVGVEKIGATGGALAQIVIKPLMRIPAKFLTSANSIINYFRGKPNLTKEEEFLRKKIEQSIDPDAELDAMKGQLKAYKDSPITLQDIGPAEIRNLAKSIIVASDPESKAKNILLDFTKRRSKEANRRITNKIREVFSEGKNKAYGKDFTKTLDEIQTDLKTISNDMYAQVINKTIPIEGSLAKLMKFPDIKKGINTAIDLVKNDVNLLESPNIQKILIKNLENITNKKTIKTLDIKTLDQIKRGIDVSLKESQDNFGRLDMSNPKIRSLVNIRKRFVELIDKTADKYIGNDYKKARKLYAEGFKKEEAYELGSKFLKGGGNLGKQKEFYASINKMSESERLHFMLGAANGLDELVSSNVNPNAIIKSLSQKPSYDKVLTKIFGNNSRGKLQKRKFKQFLESESAILETTRKNLGGSDTAENLASAKANNTIAGDLIDGASYLAFGTGPITQVLGGKKILQGFGQTNRIMPTDMQDNLANILKETDKEEILKTLNRIKPTNNVLGSILRRGSVLGPSSMSGGNISSYGGN